MKPTAILLLHCPDKQGIISEITRFITDNLGNIVYLDQYVDRADGMFFMRIEWELDNFLIPREEIKEHIDALYSNRYKTECNLYFNDVRPRMAIFAGKESHCLYDLLARYKSGEMKADIPCIISNHDALGYVAEQFDIPFHVWKIEPDLSDRNEVEQEETELLKRENVDFIVLARYMQILSSDMVRAYQGNIINIHPSFIPSVGTHPYHDAWKRGMKMIGATSHYVTADVDSGPIIEQDVVRISHKDTPESLILKGRDLEKIVLSRAVEKHIEHKILTYHDKTIIFS